MHSVKTKPMFEGQRGEGERRGFTGGMQKHTQIRKSDISFVLGQTEVKVLNQSIRSRFCFRSHLLHRGVIKEDPFGGLGVEGEGTVVAAGVADHPHEL